MPCSGTLRKRKPATKNLTVFTRPGFVVYEYKNSLQLHDPDGLVRAALDNINDIGA